MTPQQQLEEFKKEKANGSLDANWFIHQNIIRLEEETAELAKLQIAHQQRFDSRAVEYINTGGRLTDEQADSIKYLGHYQAITELLTTKQAELEEWEGLKQDL